MEQASAADLRTLFTELNVTENVILEEFLKHINEDEDLFKETFKLFGRVDVQEIFHAAETKTLDQLNL